MYSRGRDPFKFLNAMEMARSSMNILHLRDVYFNSMFSFVMRAKETCFVSARVRGGLGGGGRRACLFCAMYRFVGKCSLIVASRLTPSLCGKQCASSINDISVYVEILSFCPSLSASFASMSAMLFSTPYFLPSFLQPRSLSFYTGINLTFRMK